jgi:hypothetical protein
MTEDVEGPAAGDGETFGNVPTTVSHGEAFATSSGNSGQALASATPPLDRTQRTSGDVRAIRDIKIRKRHRHDLGDIEALARNIIEVGHLLHPVVVTSNNDLIAGHVKSVRGNKVSAHHWAQGETEATLLSNICRAEAHLLAVSRRSAAPHVRPQSKPDAALSGLKLIRGRLARPKRGVSACKKADGGADYEQQQTI